MNRLTRKYFIMDDGRIDNINSSINCFESVLYNALRDYNCDYKFVFCGDINLKIAKKSNKFGYLLNNIALHKILFKVKRLNPNYSAIQSVLEEQIDTGKIVSVRTMFDELQEYCYSTMLEKKGFTNTHFCLVIGYDSENYYVVDHPTMFIKENLNTYKLNKTVALIHKDDFIKALNTFCDIAVIDINNQVLKSINKVTILKDAIDISIKGYTDNGSFRNDNSVHVGRASILKMIELMHSDLAAETIKNLQNDYFFLYLLHSRRFLLNNCLKDLEDMFNKDILDKAIKQLDRSIVCWKSFYYIVSKSTMKPDPQICNKVNKLLEKILFVEDELIKVLSNLNIQEMDNTTGRGVYEYKSTNQLHIE